MDKSRFEADILFDEATRAESEYQFAIAAALWLRAAEHLRGTDLGRSATAYAYAARCMEKTEHGRVIARIWAAAGDVIGLSDPHAVCRRDRRLDDFNHSDLFGVLQNAHWESPNGTQSTDPTADRVHRQAWVYEWAAQRCGFYGEYSNAVKYRRLEALSWGELLKRRDSVFSREARANALAESCWQHAIAFGSLPDPYDPAKYIASSAAADPIDDFHEMALAFRSLLRESYGVAYYKRYRRYLTQIYRELLSAGSTDDSDRVFLELSELLEFRARHENQSLRFLWLRCSHVLSLHGLSTRRLLSAVALVFFGLYPFLYFSLGLVRCDGTKATFLDCEYFSLVTAATVGYGDCVPSADMLARTLVMSEILVSVVFVAQLVQLVTRRVVQRR